MASFSLTGLRTDILDRQCVPLQFIVSDLVKSSNHAPNNFQIYTFQGEKYCLRKDRIMDVLLFLIFFDTESYNIFQSCLELTRFPCLRIKSK